MNAAQRNPNATVAVAATPASVFVVWIAGNVFHLSISAEEAVVFGGAVTAVLLAVGRVGVLGIWNGILHGFGSTPKE